MGLSGVPEPEVKRLDGQDYLVVWLPLEAVAHFMQFLEDNPFLEETMTDAVFGSQGKDKRN